MKTAWWKRPLKLSVLWVALVFVLAVFGFWYISGSQDPSMTLTGHERARHLGRATGVLLILGIAAIWVPAYKRRHKG